MGSPCEPSLEELFGDGAIRQLMASDGVSETTLRALLGRIRQTRQDGQTVRARPPAGCWCL